MPNLRTFVAVELAAGVKARAAEAVRLLAESGADVSWAATGSMHLTLKFLGNVREEEMPDVCRVVTAAAAQVETFEFLCRGIGAFPRNEEPRTIWIGIDEGAEALCGLQATIEDALKRELGFPKEARRFLPHLTLGRVKREADPARNSLVELINQMADFKADLTAVDEAVVFSSFLRRSGPEYEAIVHAPLSG